MRRVLGLVGVATTAVVVAAVVTSGAPEPDDDGTGVRPPDRGTIVAAGGALTGFDACDDLVGHLREVARARPVEFGGFMTLDAGGAMEAETMEESAADAVARDGAAPGADVTGTSDTNVQVAGVDELDLVETDGRRIWTATNGRLAVVDVAGAVPERLADVPLDLPGGAVEGQLLRHEDRLLVVAHGWQDHRVGAPPPAGGAVGEAAMDMVMPAGQPVTTLVLFDVAADEPTEIARADVEGELVAGRGVDGTAHLVVAHRPQPIAMPLMEEVWRAPDPAAAEREMARALESTTVTDWLPGLRHEGADGVVQTSTTVACRDVVRPVDTQDPSMLQVLSLDVHDGDLVPEGATAVLTDARHVTASVDQLVVATPVWHHLEQPMLEEPAVDAPVREMVAPAPEQVTTRLHLFDLGPDGTTHRASGEVPGTLLNQFSMSLHADTLRVATTAGEPWGGNTESGVTVLRRAGDRLETIGSVGGLGRGETIHAVRFMGDRAYVVTFRQTDPLYTIDLSDPTNPVATGELKITGYSAYLHPLAEDRLLGVGQEATLEGQVTGTQVSVFDVGDPAAPTRLSQVMLPNTSSEAEWDHHAVLVHDGLVAMPFQRWDHPTPDRPEGFEAAVMVLGLNGDTVRMRGTVASSADQPDPWTAAVRRVLVVDGRLVTVSPVEVGIHDPESLETTGTTAL